MKEKSVETKRVCQVCGSDRRLRRGVLVRPSVVELIKRDVPEWSDQSWICLVHLQKYRHEYVRSMLEAEKGELTDLENEVLESLRQHEILSQNPEEEQNLALGQRLADRIASFGGSWKFIILFAVVIIAWMVVNTAILWSRPFDPFPFILLNLVLSCLAALQAPVIMMSQNRQEARDRRQAQRDYQTNLKAELEIRQLHQKIDHLLSHQWERLVEIQNIQMDLIQELRGRR